MEKKVVITDDSWVTRQYLSKLVRKNFEVTIIEAVDGEDALSKIAEHQPACLFLDLLMPNKGGEEVLAEMQSKGMNIPTIVLTADIQTTTKKRCMELGASYFLNKPPDEEILRQYVTEILEK
jgi:CheY-like chemotaxis protein